MTNEHNGGVPYVPPEASHKKIKNVLGVKSILTNRRKVRYWMAYSLSLIVGDLRKSVSLRIGGKMRKNKYFVENRR